MNCSNGTCTAGEPKTRHGSCISSPRDGFTVPAGMGKLPPQLAPVYRLRYALARSRALRGGGAAGEAWPFTAVSWLVSGRQGNGQPETSLVQAAKDDSP